MRPVHALEELPLNTYKRLAAMLLAAVAIVAIAATTSTAKQSQPKASSDVKVGLVTDIAGLGDKSFNYLAGQGFKQAVKKYGIPFLPPTSRSRSRAARTCPTSRNTPSRATTS